MATNNSMEEIIRNVILRYAINNFPTENEEYVFTNLDGTLKIVREN